MDMLPSDEDLLLQTFGSNDEEPIMQVSLKGSADEIQAYMLCRLLTYLLHSIIR